MGCKGETHRFFCMRCGKETMPIYRKAGKEKGKFHRKKLWCVWCHETINCVEVRNDEEKQEFLESYSKGEFQEEMEESLKHTGEALL